LMRALNFRLMAYIRRHDKIYTELVNILGKLFHILGERSILQTTYIT
jgi:hypothetical protein